MRSLLYLDSYGTGLTVRAGLLHAIVDDREALSFIPSQHSLKTIIVANHGFISTNAVEWTSREHVLLVMRPDMAIAVLCDAPAGRTGRRELALRRCQMECVLDPTRRLVVARAIVATKLRTLRLDPSALGKLELKLAESRSLQDCLVVEAEAGALYWRRWQGFTLVFKGAGYPDAWTTFNSRTRAWRTGRLGETGRQFSNRFALHPLNALVNYGGGIVIALLTRACTGLGLDPAFGALHGEKPGRQGLAWDCYELLRARVEATVFEFAVRRTFTAGDFKLVKDPRPHLRFRPGVAKALAEHVLRHVPFTMCVKATRKVASWM